MNYPIPRRRTVKLSTKMVKALVPCLLVLGPLFMSGRLQAKNEILGKIELQAANKPAKESGVWVDGQYVGFVKELKGSKKILLLPGKHRIQAQQSGYVGFSEEVTLGPGEIKTITVSMEKDNGVNYSNNTAQLKISGNPE